MINFFERYKNLFDAIKNEKPFETDVAIILGSGLGDFANKFEIVKSILTSSLPDYPPSTVTGHEGKIIFAKFNNKKILLFKGRIHFYEGYLIHQCVLPVLIAKILECKKIIFTNAAGGINPHFVAGDLMLINSLISFNINKELTDLIHLATYDAKNRMLNFPSKELNSLIENSALEEKIKLVEGVYLYNKGPSYETPAEIQMFKKFGADAVGMSTVHEAIFASYLGMEVAGISCITNLASGISTQKLSHEEVTETANKVKDKFERLLKRVLDRI